MADQEQERITVMLDLPKDQIERLKRLLPNPDHKRSATAALNESLRIFEEKAKEFVVSGLTLQELCSRAGVPMIRDPNQILWAFERATGIDTETVHVRLDPGIASEVREFSHENSMSFQEMAKQILEQAVVDRYMHACDRRILFFAAPEWETMLKSLKAEKIHTGQDLSQKVVQVVGSKVPRGSVQT